MFSSTLYAQVDELDAYVKSLFPKNKNITYIDLYGYIDNKYKIQFYLGYNENEWKGNLLLSFIKNKNTC
ncbi:MAG: hypothetical protein R2771_10930 [Saprospiraceae bacterium]